MSYASDTEDYGDVAGNSWPGEGSDMDSGAPPATPAHVACGLTLPSFHLRLLDSASEYAQSDEDQDADAMDVDDGGASDGTDEEVEDRPPSDSGRDDELDQQGAQEFEYVHPLPISKWRLGLLTDRSFARTVVSSSPSSQRRTLRARRPSSRTRT